MQVDELPSIDPNVDYKQILPIQQKRLITFINHFLMNTVDFLNIFSQSCESRLIEFEYKLQKVESSLLILESQLSSIPGLDSDKSENDSNQPAQPEPTKETFENEKVESTETKQPDTPILPEINSAEEKVTVEEGIKACEDPRYKKFFKMVQFGVPESAVKLKMKSEGINPDILDNPKAIIPGLNKEEFEEDQNSDHSSDT